MKPERLIKPDLIFKPDQWVGKLNSKPREKWGPEKKGRSRCISHSSYLQKICLDSNLDYFIYCANSVPLAAFNLNIQASYSDFWPVDFTYIKVHTRELFIPRDLQYGESDSEHSIPSIR